VVVPIENTSPLLCELDNDTEQLSDAVGAVHVTTASHELASVLTVMSVGQFAITGTSVSTTVTSNEHVAVLPAPSVAVYVTVVVAIGNTSPLLCELDNDTEQLSDAVGAVHVTTAPHVLASVINVISVGQFAITGTSVSTTVTSNEHVAVLPAPSVAVYVTVVVPIGNTSPL